MSHFIIDIAGKRFHAEVESAAPQTCAWLAKRSPFDGEASHGRWSGEAGWIRLMTACDLAPENATSYPAPGQLLLYPGGVSEPEILLPYGPCAFASRAGMLAGNHFATISHDLAAWREIGEGFLQTGAQPVRIRWSA